MPRFILWLDWVKGPEPVGDKIPDKDRERRGDLSGNITVSWIGQEATGRTFENQHQDIIQHQTYQADQYKLKHLDRALLGTGIGVDPAPVQEIVI